MNRIFFFLAMAVFFAQISAWAQSNDKIPSLTYQGNNLTYFLGKHLKYPKELINCEKNQTLVAIKFKLDAKGKVVFVEAVGNIGDTTKNSLEKLLLQTSGYWKTRYVNGKAVPSHLIIQPILFKLFDCENRPQTTMHNGYEASLEKIFTVDNNEDCSLLRLIVVTTNLYGSEETVK